MEADALRLNHALLAYLGVGRSPLPLSDQNAVFVLFGQAAGQELLAQISNPLRDVNAIDVDWSVKSLGQAGAKVRGEMKRLHPTLDDEALDAITWKFTYDWR